MLPNFLCPTHHKHYQQAPEEAVLAWDNWMAAGHRAQLDKEPERAFRFYGSSMEVADILMQNTHLLTAITPFERFQLASQHLAELCQRNGHEDIGDAVRKKLQNTFLSQRHRTLNSFNYAANSREEESAHLQSSLCRLH